MNLIQVWAELSIYNLVMNKLGQGDNHEREKVKAMIRYIFSNTNINIFENYKSLSYYKGAILKCNNTIYLLIL